MLNNCVNLLYMICYFELRLKLKYISNLRNYSKEDKIIIKHKKSFDKTTSIFSVANYNFKNIVIENFGSYCLRTI